MKKTGFTLVEILIVVIILGILAAIVIPQFTEASNDARTSALSSDLQTLRSQIELYKVQHNERTPDLNELGAANTANFVTRLTGRTDQDGKVNAASGAYGPYLQKFPSNSFISTGANVVVFGTTPAVTADTGWYYDTGTNQIYACDSTDHLAL